MISQYFYCLFFTVIMIDEYLVQLFYETNGTFEHIQKKN